MKKYIIIIVFGAFLLSPFFFESFFPKDNSINIENRVTKQKPVFSLDYTSLSSFSHSLKTYIHDYEDYHDDNFYFRNEYVQAYNVLKTMTKTNSVEKRVVVGTDGWLYLGNSFSDLVYENLGYSSLTKEELEEIKSVTLDRKAFCDSLGIKFMITLAPEKQTIYNEYYPIKGKKGPSRLDQVAELLESCGVDYVNIIDTLFAEKSKQQIYYKNDSHWNVHGAFCAYRKLIEKAHGLLPDITPLTLDNIGSVVYETGNVFDLTKMMMVTIDESYPLYLIKDVPFDLIRNFDQKKSVVEKDGKTEEFEYLVSQSECPSRKGHVITFADSYFIGMFNFFASSVNKLQFYQTINGIVAFDKELIKRERPDMVICEIVERNVEKLAETEYRYCVDEQSDDPNRLNQTALNEFGGIQMEKELSATNNFCVEYVNNAMVMNAPNVQIDYQSDLTFIGWAYDCKTKGALGEIFAMIGDTIVAGRFDLERDDVRKLTDCTESKVGFTLTVPKECLINTKGDRESQVKFVLVGKNRKHIFRPLVKYIGQ